MLEAILVATAVGRGMAPGRLALLALAVFAPVPALALVAIHIWRGRRQPDLTSVTFCEAVADELRGGSTLRRAIVQAADSVGEDELARLGGDCPVDLLAESAAAAFPDVGAELKSCIERSSWSGAPASDLFDELAGLALAQVELRQEVRTAMGPAVVSAVVLLAGPVIALWMILSRGHLGDYLSTGPQRIAVISGLGLVTVAFTVGALMVRRAS